MGGVTRRKEDTMYRILIVEDDLGIGDAVRSLAEKWGLQARCVKNFRDVMEEFNDFDPHLVLLDITLPFFNGYHWCNEIRRISKVPILFLSSASDNMNMVMAMNMGGDDFIPKPFDQSILIAKIQAMLRRSYDFGTASPVLEHRGAVLSTGDNTLTYNGQKLELTKKRIPDRPGADGGKGQGGQPGEADGAALGLGQLRGREHPDGEREPSAEKAGRGGVDRLHPDQSRDRIYDRRLRGKARNYSFSI